MGRKCALRVCTLKCDDFAVENKMQRKKIDNLTFKNSVDEYIVTYIFHTALFGLSVVELKMEYSRCMILHRRSSGLQVFETVRRVFYQDNEW